MIVLDNISFIQWALLTLSSLLLIWFSPLAKTTAGFFQAAVKNHQPGVWMLTSSLVISWIFAKSITNAANLGLKYGILGGLSYAAYYLSFLVAGYIIYELRTKGGYTSIHHFLSSKFGKSAVILFSILIGFRLLNEVWSNTMVIGSYFGSAGSYPYYAAIVLFTLLTLVYSLKGGLSSSIFTDVIQMVLFGGLLIVILFMLFPQFNGNTLQSDWSFEGGADLMLVALIQSFSYPFHDPVMTDRGFLTDAKTMKTAFFLAAPIGFVSILLFSLVGVYARDLGVVGDATLQVAQSFGIVMTLLINFIMITSASSTLDSAFASFSKLSVIDLRIMNTSVTNGRLVMVLMMILGTIPVFFNPEILTATTVSGTMVIGLAPIFIFWRAKLPKYTFVVVVLLGSLFGISLATNIFPDAWTILPTDYGKLLSVNCFGTVACFLVFGIFWKFRKGYE